MKKTWQCCANVFVGDVLLATIRTCDALFCFYISKQITIDDKIIKRKRQIDFASFDTAHNELLNYMRNKYEIDESRIFIQKTSA